MATKSERQKAIYTDIGKIVLETGPTLDWDNLDIPFGAEVEVMIRYEKEDYLSGSNGIVWATQSFEQAETIKGALEAQGIPAEIANKGLAGTKLYLLKIPDASRIDHAIDFIWRSDEGLKLQPDWHYPANARNESFVRWVNGG